VPVETGDRELIQIVDAAMAEAARKSGAWLVCRPGCSSCCIGLFPITHLDADRLRRGLVELAVIDPGRASRVHARARQAAAEITRALPAASIPELLDTNYGDEEPCPALDPETGTCDLYTARPINCRTFGPPVRCGSESVGICELCFVGASDDDIAACEVEVDPDGVESELLRELEQTTGKSGNTIVAFALAKDY